MSSRPAEPRTSSQAIVPGRVLDDLQRARTTLFAAELTDDPSEKYLAAHLCALRVAAVVLAVRAGDAAPRSGPTDVWTLVARLAPEYAEWAGFFATTARRRNAVRQHQLLVCAREADDLVRDAGAFLALVERKLLPPRQAG